jgi:hypothetical protein
MSEYFPGKVVKAALIIGMSKLHVIRVRGTVAGLLGLGALLVLAGCSREEVRVYRVPKEEPRLTSVTDPASARQGDSAMPHLHWDLPSGWREVQGSSIRLATFSIPSPAGPPAEVSITPLQGVTGVESDAVDIWRSELGLAKGGGGKAGEPVTIGEFTGTLYDLTSSDERGIIGAVASFADSSWFFKMSGPASLLAREKDAFVGFLKSIEFHAEAHPEQNGAVAAKQPGPSTPSSAGDRPPWEAPQHWEEFPPKTMLLANYAIRGGASESGEVTVSAFPGDVGGLLANVNRWRGQIGLGAIGQSELAGISSPIEIHGERATLIDMTAEASSGKAPIRVVVAVVPRGPQTWFFKISGDEPLVAREKAAFIQFVQSVRFNHVS